MNKITKQIIRFVLFIPIVIAGSILLSNCSKDSGSNQNIISAKIKVTEQGAKIEFPMNAPGLERIKSTTVNSGRVMISVFAPSRVVATISSGSSSKEKIILFDSPDIASLYSSYRQAKSNVELTTKSLDRIRDMFNNLAATGKDLNQAETDAANAKVSLSEMESRLRTAGYDPKELENTQPGTVWLISDVLESQLNEVDKGEAVDIYFNAFPDKKYEGRAVSIGDVVDPTTRTVKVRVSLKDPNGKFLPGMFAKIDYGDPKNNCLAIPLSAVVTVEGNDYVYEQKTPGEFERKKVILGQQNETQVIVLKGINSGENIVTDGAILLKGLSFNY